MARVYRISTRVAGGGRESRRITNDVKRRTRNAVYETLRFAHTFMITNKLVPVNLGPLQASLLPNTGDIRVENTRVEGTLSSPLIHAIVMELGRGRRRRMPPLAAIEAWVMRKAPGLDPEAVRRSIARKGTKPRKFLESTAKKLETEFPKILKRWTDAS